jgi:hypothetical protein
MIGLVASSTCWMVIVLLATGSIPRSAYPQSTKHPVEAFRRVAVREVGRIALGARPVSDAYLAGIERSLATISSPLIIGALDEPAEEVFGALTDVEADAEGRLVVLDGRHSVVRVFDANGRYENSVGGPGMGPGELRAPKSLVIGTNGSLYVFDATRRVHVFTRRANAHRYQRTVTLPVDAADACLLGEELLVLGMSATDSAVLHVFDQSLKWRRSFGVVYRSGSLLVDIQVGQGRLLCLDRPRVAIISPLSILGEIRAYSVAGKELWVTRLDGMRPIDFEETGGGLVVEIPAGGFHRFQSLFAGADGSVYAQVSLETREGRQSLRPYSQLLTVRLRLENGRGDVVSVTAPRLSTVGSRVASLNDDPHPHLKIARTVRE